MTKPINFTAIEVLPSLLRFFETKGKEGKTQTIRPAWKEVTDIDKASKEELKKMNDARENPNDFPSGMDWEDLVGSSKQTFRRLATEKPPTHKPGDKVKLYWNQRSKYKMFCNHCGKEKQKDLPEPLVSINEKEWWICRHCKKEGLGFNKLLGTVEITEVFKIEMDKKQIYSYIFNGTESITKMETELIAERDGFQDGVIPLKGGVAGNYSVETAAEQMFKYFDKNYNLSEPKEFWIKRWVWIK